MTEDNGRDLISKIRQIARNRTTIDIAQMQFIGLDEVRKTYGERWRLERDRVQQIAHEFVRRRIPKDDILIPCDNGFVVIFGVVEGMDATVQAHALGQSLNRFFLGEEGAKLFHVEVTQESVPVQEISAYMGGIRAANVGKATNGQAAPSDSQSETTVGFRFQPVLDVAHQAVTTYFTEAFNVSTGAPIPGYRFEENPPAAARLLEIDELALQASETALRTLFRSGKKAIVGVSLHISSMTRTENRLRLLNIIGRFDRELSRYRALRISGVVPGFPRLYLDETVNVFRARLPHVLVGMNATEADLSTALDCGAWGLSYVFPPDAKLPSDGSLSAKMRKDVSTAHTRHKRFHVDGPLSRQHAEACALAHVDFLASTELWAPRKEPTGVFRWPRATGQRVEMLAV